MKKYILFLFTCVQLFISANAYSNTGSLSQRGALNCMAENLYKNRGGIEGVTKMIVDLEEFRKTYYLNSEELYEACLKYRNLKSEPYDLLNGLLVVLNENFSHIDARTLHFVLAAISPFSICHEVNANLNIAIGINAGAAAGLQVCRSSNGQIWHATRNTLSLGTGFGGAALIGYRYYISKDKPFDESYLVGLQGMAGQQTVSMGAMLAVTTGGVGIDGTTYDKMDSDIVNIIQNLTPWKIVQSTVMFDREVAAGAGVGLMFQHLEGSLILKGFPIENLLVTKRFNAFPTEIFLSGIYKAMEKRIQSNVIGEMGPGL